MALGAPATVRADERAEALQHYAKGKKAFELGAYGEAVAEYTTAYRLRDDPALLYNLGQAHRLADQPLEALRSYRMFLIRVPDASNRDEVQQKILDLQTLIEQRRKAASVPIDAARPIATASSPLNPPDAAQRDPVDRSAGRSKAIAGAALDGVGIAAVVGGVVCGVLAKQNSDSLSKLDQTMQAFNSGQASAGKMEQGFEGALIGVGAAALLTGSVLLILGQRERKRARNHVAIPSLGRSHADASAQVVF